MQILIGTYNKHKAEEISKIINEIAPGRVDFVMPDQILKKKLIIEETGATFADNALLKAKAFFEATSVPCLSDDSGIEAPALNYAPGVYSARYAGIESDDKKNRLKLLEEMKYLKDGDRKAQFKTVLCLYGHEITLFSEGCCKGEIIFEERGSGGFGYDCIFVPEGHIKTFAEMSAEEKNALSHRRKAAEDFAFKLVERFQNNNNQR